MTSLTPRELADRARASSRCRITETDAHTYLAEWREQGIVEEVLPGRWQLSERGAAMFGGWAIGIELDDEDGLA